MSTIALRLFVSASILAFSESTFAQAVSPTVPDTAPVTPSNPTPESGIADIVVTAQKQSQTLQRTPAAVTALTGEALVARGITDLVSAQNYVPSARIQFQASTVEVYIRGIGSSNDFANTESPTSFNINGVYVPREGSSIPIFDIERVEVLPGPQGTLYGRSSLGGAVNVIFKRPTREFETQGTLELGNYDLVHGTLVQNIPLSNDLALRAGIDYREHDGYLKSGSAAPTDLNGRLSLLATPSENVTAYIWGLFVRGRGTTTNLVNKGFNPDTQTVDGKSFLHDDPWDDRLNGPLAQFAAFGPVVGQRRRYDNRAIGGQFDFQLGEVKITDIPAYFDINLDQDYFVTALPGTYNAKIKSYSNELRASGDTDRLKWQAGINIYRMVNSDASGIRPIFFNFVNNRSTGIGLYAHGTYSFSSVFRVTVGGRFSSDKRRGRGRVSVVPFQPAAVPWTADVDSKRVDWKVGVEYDAADRVMLYATAQSGYQPATYNTYPNSATFNNRIDAPTITAFSGGFKSRFLDSKLQVNSEAFYYVYKGLPLQAVDFANTFYPIFNAKRVEIYGNQLDVVLQPTADDRLTTSVGYLHARQTRAVVPTGLIYGSIGGADFSGLQVQNAPDWTISASYSHDFQLAKGYIRLLADTRYESAFFGVYTHAAGTRQKPYLMSDASLTYYADRGRWSLGVWVRNIENEPVQAAVGAGGLPGPAAAVLQAPRTFGMRSTFAF